MFFFPKEIIILLGITAVFLLLAAEALSYYPRLSICVSKKRLRVISVVVTLIFLSTIILRVLNLTSW
jgi:hypothetical protein